MKLKRFSIPGRWLLSLSALILLASLGAVKADAAGYYMGMRCDNYYEIEVGDMLTLDVPEHVNQTGIYWTCWRGIETRNSLTMGNTCSTHNLGNYGLSLISRTLDIDDVAHFGMGSGNSATITGLKPGVIGVISHVRYWYTYYDTYLKMQVVAEQDAEQTIYTVIRVLGTPCTLTFNANGGAENTYTQSANTGTSVSLSPNRFTRNGYTFTGWNTKADGTGTSYADRANVTLSGDLILYAQWEREGLSCTLTFDANGGEGSSYTQLTVENKTVILLSNRFTRDGYMFTGWNTKADGTGTSYANGANVTPDGNLTLYAQWKGLPCVLTFNANGGENDSYTQSATTNESIKLLPNRFNRNNYTFTVWNTESDGTGISYANEASIIPSGNLTLYAQWVKQESGSCGDNLIWLLNGDGVLSISGEGAMSEGAFDKFSKKNQIKSVIISDGVTNISAGAFYYCSELRSITIPNSVTSIGSSAFLGCESLTNVTIPSSVKSIGRHAFDSCKALTSIIIPNGVTNIAYAAFMDSGLTSITIPRSVTSIDGYALCGTKLASITIPDGVNSIGEGAFSICSDLLIANIPDSVTSIGPYAFTSCDSLTSITLGRVKSIDEDAFAQCSGLTNVVIPEGVTSIGHGAFSDCNGLVSIMIPGSVTSIGDSAFYGCSSLREVSYAGDSLKWEEINIESANDLLTNAMFHWNTTHLTTISDFEVSENTVTASIYTSETACVYCASYDASGRFLAVYTQELNRGRADSVTFEMADGATLVKFFVLDDILRPLCKCAEKSVA